ncbi:MAG: M61 family metallopeptidase [Flavobacteriia bacterium]|jgi:predicted metalloprotease with PDZ domain
MISYKFSIENASSQYIQIQLSFESSQAIEHIQLPSWRPGRYELGNFAKNVKNFKVYGDEKTLAFEKTTKDCWKLETNGAKQIQVSYQYYATDLNAGATYLDKNQLYVNPVNCCAFIVGREMENIEVQLEIPNSHQIACALPHENKVLKAKHFDELADSPFIASASLQHDTYKVNDTLFHIWFQGEVKVNWEKILKDFNAFTSKQIEKFSEFPVPEYHFFFQIVPFRAYHGVEHQTSTVILLGPSYDIFEATYVDLLGVSSHELYHTWNVKSIRPIEMWPYDFTKENYSKLGYLCEGVTTYMGDLFLLKSGVFKLKDYFLELNDQLQKHFDNFARFNYSVAESSWDTWLDGYVPGAPNRKVSIYTEGCLLALVTDVFIMRNSKEKYNLDDVMKRLYFDYYLNGKGVSEKDYQNVVEQVANASFQEILDNYFYDSKPFEAIIVDAFEYLGLELIHKASPKYSYAKLGFKSIPQGQNFIVKAIYPGSPAEMGGLMLEDEIIAVNSYVCGAELDKWLTYFDDNIKVLSVMRRGKLIEITMPIAVRNFYLDYSVKQIENPNQHQKRGFERWVS